MANHRSAEKRNRQNIVRRARNRSARSAVRTAVKAARTAGSKELTVTAESVIAKAAAKGVLHKRTAARLVSRLTKRAKAAAK